MELVERLERDRLNGTARLLSRVLVCLTRPFAYARRTWTTPAARSTSPCSSPNSSEGRSPVAAANTIIGPKAGPSRSVTDRICAQESNGRCSRQRRLGFGTLLAGLSIILQATARFSTCRSALQPRRTAACDPIPVRVQRLPVRARRLQLEHLPLLDHLGTSSIDNEIEESHPRRADDHPSLTERWHTSRRVEQGGTRLGTLSESFEQRVGESNRMPEILEPDVLVRRVHLGPVVEGVPGCRHAGYLEMAVQRRDDRQASPDSRRDRGRLSACLLRNPRDRLDEGMLDRCSRRLRGSEHVYLYIAEALTFEVRGEQREHLVRVLLGNEPKVEPRACLRG